MKPETSIAASDTRTLQVSLGVVSSTGRCGGGEEMSLFGTFRLWKRGSPSSIDLFSHVSMFSTTQPQIEDHVHNLHQGLLIRKHFGHHNDGISGSHFSVLKRTRLVYRLP